MRSFSPINTICFLGNYLPRKCGIATFTTDVCEAVAAESPSSQCFTFAMNDIPEGYDYPERVRMCIDQEDIDAYERAAEFLNVHHIDVLCVQHEYGIYGGTAGEHLLSLLRTLSMPVVTTLHTVLQEPDPNQRRILIELCNLSDRVIVMSDRGRLYLETIYGIAPERIVHIPHGIPDVSFIDPTYYKDKFGAVGKQLLLTFGLLSPGKGIEMAIRALPAVVAKFPDTKYVVLGATHPGVIRNQGESYRESLVSLADELGVSENVEFINQFVSLESLREYLCASDIYITPYLSATQITSGTLAYAVGTGNAVVSTPYWYAEELLADNRGRLVPFNDVDALSREISGLLGNPVERNAMRKRAYEFSRKMTWPIVAADYMDLFEHVREERESSPHPARTARISTISKTPEINFDHICVLTDDTGLLQHALFSIPDRREGYCSDDNARALAVMCRASDVFPQKRDEFKRLAARYVTFIGHAIVEPSRRFRNFMAYGRQWLDNTGSEDCHGRCLAGVGYLVGKGCFPGLISLATRIFDHTMPVVDGFSSPRAWAYSITGLLNYLERFSGDLDATRRLVTLANRLMAGFAGTEDKSWPWPEAELTYANAVIPHALIGAGSYLGSEEMLDRGIHALEWLFSLQTTDDGHLSILGNRGWYRRNCERAVFDQQPIEAQTLVEACAEAYFATDDERWIDRISVCLHWFLGANDLGLPLYDEETGGCKDGLQPNGPNANEGAESTLAWLQSALIARNIGA